MNPDAQKVRAERIKSHGGLSNKPCAWRGCAHRSLADMAICFEHTYPDFQNEMLGMQQAAREREQSPVIESDRFNRPPPSINSADSACCAIAYMAKTWSPPLITIDGDGKKEIWKKGGKVELGDRGPQDFDAECDALDQQISRFIAGNPGTVEALLLDKSYQDLLALTRAGGEEPYFSVLMKLQTHASPARGELLWRTLRACDPAAILRCLSDSVNRHRVLIEKNNFGWGMPWQLMSSLAGWLGPKRYGQLRTQVKPPELQDALMCAAYRDHSHRRPVAAVHFKLPESRHRSQPMRRFWKLPNASESISTIHAALAVVACAQSHSFPAA